MHARDHDFVVGQAEGAADAVLAGRAHLEPVDEGLERGENEGVCLDGEADAHASRQGLAQIADALHERAVIEDVERRAEAVGECTQCGIGHQISSS